MSWIPRVPSFGRFSPFSGTPKGHPSSPAARVTEDDFSYITSEDIQNHEQSSSHSHHHDPNHHHTHPGTSAHSHAHASSSHNSSYPSDPRRSDSTLLTKTSSYPEPATKSTTHLAAPDSHGRPRSRSRAHSRSRETSRVRDDRPARDTDTICFRHKGTQLSVHFPAYAIDDGIVTVGSAREHAARRVDTAPGRLRMFWKGKNLKDDKVALRDLGVMSSDRTEIMVVVGTADGSSDSESEEADEIDGDGRKIGRRTKRRGGGKKRKGKKPVAEKDGYVGASAPAEHLPIPSGSHPLHKSTSTPASGRSGPSSRQPSPQPTTPLGKLAQLDEKFTTELLPMAQGLMRNPPADKDKREYEYKKVTETIMTQILLKVDGVETEGDEEARARRKALVKTVQGCLNEVDAVFKK